MALQCLEDRDSIPWRGTKGLQDPGLVFLFSLCLIFSHPPLTLTSVLQQSLLEGLFSVVPFSTFTCVLPSTWNAVIHLADKFKKCVTKLKQ